MKNKWIFLRWSLLVSLTFIAFVIAWKLNAFRFAWEKDSTKITFVIIAIFAVMTNVCGYLTWKANKIADENNLNLKIINKLRNDARHIDVAASFCMMLGLLGTICGMILAFFSSGELAAESHKQLGVAVGTAFVTTGCGLICAMLLTIQHHNLDHALTRVKIDSDKNGGGDE